MFPTKMLLATDGSKDAYLATRAAVDVCEGTGAELMRLGSVSTKVLHAAGGPVLGCPPPRNET